MANNFDRKAYMKKYLNSDKFKVCVICDTCGGKYKIYNKDHHMKTQKHATSLRHKKEIEEIEKAFELKMSERISCN